MTILKDKQEILGLYDVYKDCMFLPSEEKFARKVDGFLADDAIELFACLEDGEPKGMMVVSFAQAAQTEIVGIAVAQAARHRGIGSYMIAQLMEERRLPSVYAETDDDAVVFYRKNGFEVVKVAEEYDGETVVRYRCRLQKR